MKHFVDVLLERAKDGGNEALEQRRSLLRGRLPDATDAAIKESSGE
jgi:hypothetical protein